MPVNIAELNALIAEAEHKGLWLFCPYQALWFSPSELRAANAEGRFRWGVVNWELRSPDDYLKRLERAALEAAQALENGRRRVHAG